METPERILITGGAGLIGSHLADALVDRGREITLLDDLRTGSFENLGLYAPARSTTLDANARRPPTTPIH
jgi:nucleoside-diphosphate-sugar epimerase